jgi:hypothetical protein
MQIISPLAALSCVLALISPKRRENVIGSIQVKYNAYNNGQAEYCFEEKYRVGKTWIEDRFISAVEVPIENCYQTAEDPE